MRVVWTCEAEEDRLNILMYLSQDSPSAAVSMDDLFERAASLLEQYPMIGNVGKVSGTREFIPHESYRLVYELDGETVYILTLVHTAKCWPPE